MKKILLSMCAMVIALAATAQSVKVYKGGELTYELDDADSIVFSEKTAPVSPEYVDLGLSVKWATFNVGANSPEDYGDYYAWGETETKSNYSWSTYKWYNASKDSMTKYCTSSSYGTVDDKTTLDADDDVAHVKWGGSWRMPTEAEWEELQNNCTWTRTSNYNGSGIAGSIVTSNKEGYTDKFIFLPDAGYREQGDLKEVGSSGDYWTSSLDTTGTSYRAWSVYFSSSVDFYWYKSDRSYGQSVRPVMK